MLFNVDGKKEDKQKEQEKFQEWIKNLTRKGTLSSVYEYPWIMQLFFKASEVSIT